MIPPLKPQLSLFSRLHSVTTAGSNAKDSGVSEPKAVLRLGDAYDLAVELEPDSIDLVLTSPPYWGLRTYDESHNWDILSEYMASREAAKTIPGYEWYRTHGGRLGLEPLPEWYIAHLVEIFSRIKPALKARGSMWINIGDTYFARWSSIRDRGRQGLGDNPRQRRKVPMGGYRQEKQLLQIPARFAIAMQECRWILRNDLIWFKPNVPPRPEKDRLRLSHEHFFHFVRRPTQGRASYYYDLTQTEPGGLDVVTVNSKGGEDDHSATFPERLIAPRILSSCPVGGTMLDPFAGTGRALSVAVGLARNAVGFEISKGFVKTAMSRLDSTAR